MNQNAISWRNTLESLMPQFQAAAAEKGALAHLMTEVADKERDKMSGPTWLPSFGSKVRSEDGVPTYGTWDCCAFAGLPTVQHGFRRREIGEDVSKLADKNVVRDASGDVQAIFVPARLRQGFFCGRSSEHVNQFKAMAEIATEALVAAEDLSEHYLASDLTGLFGPPRGGHRYIFGDVPEIPSGFVARGWQAGVLQYEHGVLIDDPIGESAPDSSHWLLLLHRLGWRAEPGSGLRAHRAFWHENYELEYRTAKLDRAQLPEGFRQNFENMSMESFYSVLGTKEAPLDINFASVLAIQLLLADLEVRRPNEYSENYTDYTNEDWYKSSIPRIKSFARDDVPKLFKPSIGLLATTEVEIEQLLKRVKPLSGKKSVLQVPIQNNTYFLGRLGAVNVAICRSSMGTVGRDASYAVTSDLIDHWSVGGVLMIGIAFGKDSEKQSIGEVLISERVIAYEPERIGKDSSQSRGDSTRAGTVLLNRFRNVHGWQFCSPDGTDCGFQVGDVLSGEKLVDNPDFKQRLFKQYPKAIGGEMEGAGVAAASERKKVEWIVVKAICDWGDGEKNKEHQAFAAAASVSLVEKVFTQAGVLDGLA